MSTITQNLNDRWQKFSTIEQMANIGSEVGRALKWKGRDESSFWNTVQRTIELFDLTLIDPKTFKRRHEIGIAKEIFCDAVLGGKEYRSTLEDLEKYFMNFAFYVNNKI